MERLTKRNETNTAYYYPHCFEKCDGVGHSDKCDKCDFAYKVCEKLAEYEDAEEQGLLLRLPCKVGTTIYMINRYWIDEGRICGIEEADDIDCFCYKVYCDPDDYTMVAAADFNKTWFLTERKAEQALQKGSEENG